MTDQVAGVAADIVKAVSGARVAVILVGSAARQRMDAFSDIDLLVLTNVTMSYRPSHPGFHVQRMTPDAFVTNLRAGEDFEAWCVRHGVPLHDDGLWKLIVESNDAKNWPDWKRKVAHGLRRLSQSAVLLGMGDYDAAREELVYALGHAARGLLLKADVFPLSRPELSEQVKALGYRQLASLHEQLRTSESVPVRSLKLCLLYSKKLLVELDRASYEAFARDISRKLKAKAGRATTRH